MNTRRRTNPMHIHITVTQWEYYAGQVISGVGWKAQFYLRPSRKVCVV
jgi:hypothetical protein